MIKSEYMSGNYTMEFPCGCRITLWFTEEYNDEFDCTGDRDYGVESVSLCKEHENLREEVEIRLDGIVEWLEMDFDAQELCIRDSDRFKVSLADFLKRLEEAEDIAEVEFEELVEPKRKVEVSKERIEETALEFLKSLAEDLDHEWESRDDLVLLVDPDTEGYAWNWGMLAGAVLSDLAGRHITAWPLAEGWDLLLTRGKKVLGNVEPSKAPYLDWERLVEVLTEVVEKAKPLLEWE